MINENILEIDISSLAKSIRLSQYILATRARGTKFLEALFQRLNQEPKLITVLDFSGVELIDASFADEVFGTIASKYSREGNIGTSIILKNISEDNLENLEMALETRPRREQGLRNCLLPWQDAEGRLHLIGKFEGHVKQTFDVLLDYKKLTARELADLLKLEIAAASTRLKVLYDLGLVLRSEVRNEDGKQYIYTIPL